MNSEIDEEKNMRKNSSKIKIKITDPTDNIREDQRKIKCDNYIIISTNIIKNEEEFEMHNQDIYVGGVCFDEIMSEMDFFVDTIENLCDAFADDDPEKKKYLINAVRERLKIYE